MGSIPITRSIPLLLLGALLAPVPAAATTPLQSTVERTGSRYTVTFEALLDADADAVRRRLTDYDHLDRLSPAIERSEQLPPGDDGRPRVRVVMSACFLLFCRTVRKTESVTELPGGRIVTLADPNDSDYRYYRAEWRIAAEGARTRLAYRAEIEPAFSVPPVVGPWILKSRMRRELEITAGRLERLAHEPGPGP